MKKRIFSLWIALMLCAVLLPHDGNVVQAADGKCGKNVRWSVNKSWEMVISGKGDMAEWKYSADVPWYNYRGSLKKVTVEEGVTSIAPYAFYCQEALMRVKIADSVTKIGENAFMNARFMTSIDLGSGVREIGDSAFNNCRSVTEIVIPDGVTTIGANAFYDCDSLISVVIPDSVTEIGESAFSNCDSLTSITIGSGVTSIGNKAFAGCTSLTEIKVPQNAVYLVEDGVLFSKDKTMLIQYPAGKTDAYTVPDSVTAIGDWAFANGKLTEVTLPQSVTKIGNCAFYGCELLTAAALGDGVTSIGDYAFYDCDSLSAITVPASVASIGDCAFFKCNLLTDVQILTKDAAFGTNVFEPQVSAVSAYKNSTAHTYAEANAHAFTPLKENGAAWVWILAGAAVLIGAVVVGRKVSAKAKKENG